MEKDIMHKKAGMTMLLLDMVVLKIRNIIRNK